MSQTRYRLISPDGHAMGTFATAVEAASAAGGFWPGVGQDEDRTGAGWDIAVVGADRALKPPYPFCRTPEKCAGKGYCPAEFACND